MSETPAQVMAPVVIRFLARVAVADGKIDPAEVEVLIHVAATMGLPEEDARRVLDDEVHTQSDAELLARQLPDPAHLRSVFGLGCMMALAEQDVLDAFARGAGLSEAEARAILDEIAISML